MTKLKFKLTTESKVSFGVTLFRIEATVDIPERGVKKGDKGGWVDTAETPDGNARVFGNAWVFGNASIFGNARISGDARISDNASIFGNARISGDAWVSGNAKISAKKSLTKGWFIGGDDSGKITDITEQTGSTYWEKQYVLGDYEINDIYPPQTELTLQQVADKFGVPVETLRIKE